MTRPCQYCEAHARGITKGSIGASVEECEFTHRQEHRVIDLARAFAAIFHDPPTDEHIGWFLEDADAVVDDFDPVPDAWRVHQLADVDEFVATFDINGVVYVLEEGGKDIASHPIRLSTLRKQQQEAEDAT